MKIHGVRLSSHIQDWILLFAFFVNMVFFSVDPIYNLVHSYIHYFFLMIALGMLGINSVIRFERKKTIVFLITIAFAVLALRLNGSGIGNIVQLFWPMTIVFMFYNHSHNATFYSQLSLISKVFLYLLVLKSIFVYSRIDASSLNAIHDSGVVNPNIVGYMLAYLYLMTDLGESKSTKPFFKLIRVIATFVGLAMCDSRASMIGLFGVILLKVFFGNIVRQKRGFLMLVLCSFIVVGTVFPIVYVMIYKSGSFDNATILGKNVFTGRQYIWMNVFDYLEEHPRAYIIGTGYNTTFYKAFGSNEGSFNLHNAYLMLFAQFGGVIFILYMAFVLVIVYKAYNHGALFMLQEKAVWILLITFFVGFGEVTLSFIPSLIFPGIALGVINNRKGAMQYGYSKDNPLLLVRRQSKRKKRTVLY